MVKKGSDSAWHLYVSRRVNKGGRMNTVFALSIAFGSISLTGYALKNTFERKSYKGQVKAVFDVLTTFMALAVLASVVATIVLTIVGLK
jgi:hypothetical protein